MQVLFRMNITDTQCGAKVLRQSAVIKILAKDRFRNEKVVFAVSE